MTRYLVLRLSAVFSSFGTEVASGSRPTGLFPGRASLTGLLGNCLGLSTDDPDDIAWLELLQRSMRSASMILTLGERFVDYQNAVPSGTVHGQGTVEKLMARAAVPGTFRSAGEPFTGQPGGRKGVNKRIWKHYLAGHDVLTAIRFTDPGIDIDMLAEAVGRPARIVYVGRRACLTSKPLLSGIVDAGNALDALRIEGARLAAIPGEIEISGGSPRYPYDGGLYAACWDEGEGPDGLSYGEDAAKSFSTQHTVSDLRIWALGRAGGSRRVNVGRIRANAADAANAAGETEDVWGAWDAADDSLSGEKEVPA